jgi:hypothetical protein
MLAKTFPHLPAWCLRGSLPEFGAAAGFTPDPEVFMSRYILALGILGVMALAAPAMAEDSTDTYGSTPLAQPLNQRFVLIVLDQADRDLTKGDPKINMMFDTQTGRSWILEYSRKPNSNEQGYVWVEVPYAKPPTN